MRLKDKVAVVTGASRGIGKAIALAFAREGAKLVIAYQREAGQADAVVGQIKEAGGQALAAGLDVCQRESVREVFALAQQHFGRIDILVNNAGINKQCFFEEITDEDWDQVMAVNLKGPFICSQEVFPYLKKNPGGRIINISSVAGQYHGPKTVHYAVSKAGLISLTKVVARYGAPHNILVNAVAPGIILTDMTREELNSPAGARIVEMTLLKRAGELSDVTSACVFLASEEQNYLTGQVLSISGGAYLG